MKFKVIIYLIIVLFFSCNVSKQNNQKTETNQTQETMINQEESIYNEIKAHEKFGISPETLSEKLIIPVNEVKKTLQKLESDGLLEKRKADGVKLVNGKPQRFGTLIYTIRKK